MPTATVNAHPFPPGSTVGAYQNAKETQSRGQKPLGAAVETAVVADDGSLEIELDAGTYSLAAPAGGLFAQGLTFTPRAQQAVTVALVDPAGADESLSVDVTGRLITVSLATDSEEAITTDLDALVSLVNGTAGAFALVTAKLDPTVGGDTVAVAESGSFSQADPEWRYVELTVPAS